VICTRQRETREYAPKKRAGQASCGATWFDDAATFTSASCGAASDHRSRPISTSQRQATRRLPVAWRGFFRGAHSSMTHRRGGGLRLRSQCREAGAGFRSWRWPPSTFPVLVSPTDSVFDVKPPSGDTQLGGKTNWESPHRRLASLENYRGRPMPFDPSRDRHALQNASTKRLKSQNRKLSGVQSTPGVRCLSFATGLRGPLHMNAKKPERTSPLRSLCPISARSACIRGPCKRGALRDGGELDG